LAVDDYWLAWKLAEEVIADRPVDLVEMETVSESLKDSINRYGVEFGPNGWLRDTKTCGEIEDIILLLADVFLDRLRGISQTQLAQRLPLKQPAVSNAVRRGARLVRQRQYSLEPKK